MRAARQRLVQINASSAKKSSVGSGGYRAQVPRASISSETRIVNFRSWGMEKRAPNSLATSLEYSFMFFHLGCSVMRHDLARGRGRVGWTSLKWRGFTGET